MIKKFLFFFCIILSTSLFSQRNNEEFRSTWVITWEYISGSSSVEQNKARIRRILDEHKAANMTSVIWQVRQAGTAYYNSSYEPYGSYAGGSYPGFDPLEYAIEEAHTRGLELHAWFNVFASGSTAPGTPAAEHPEWICRDRDGIPMTSSIALSPGMEEVREYTKNVAMEVVRNYDIDGFHLDYIRWNEYTNSAQSERFSRLQEEKKLRDGEITEEQVNELNVNAAGRFLYDSEHPYSAGVPSGFSTWDEWWRWSVTGFVKDLHDSIRAEKPYVRLSVAALGKYNWSGWNGYSVVYQDAALWFNEGYIDQLTPMHYHWTTGSGFYGMLEGSCPQCWSQYIQPGINDKRLFTVGPPSYILNDNNIWERHEEIVEASRNVEWTDGFQFFSYGSWKSNEYFNEAREKLFPKKTKIRDTKLVSDTIPEPPVIAISKIDSLNYEVTVTPPASASSNQWFALYKGIGDSLNVDEDEIIDIKFGNSPFTVAETFDGTQDFNGKFNYAATMIDRYWNESYLSNIAETDSIPSFAPVIAASTPSEGDTVSIGTKLQFEFSKTIDTALFSIDINPVINISGYNWNAEQNMVTILSENLSFATDYIVTLPSTISDINGKALDGNNDGVPGDDFILNFSTVDQDLTGPAIVYGFPAQTDSIDVEEVISIIFDEKIDPATVNHSTVILENNGSAIGKDIRLSEIGSQSLLSVKTAQALETNSSYTIELTNGITDVFGNPLASSYSVDFITSDQTYSTSIMIDNFTLEENWWDPNQSGSTTGTIDSGTTFGYSAEYILPATNPATSAYINYHWDAGASSRLLRAYLSAGAPRDIAFDTSYVLQVYVYGDNSGNRFRVAIDEGDGASWPNHEVSQYITIDWLGWKLFEWDLSDPNLVGSWIGNGVLDFPLYRIDSFQMTNSSGSKNYGRIYLDNLRVIKKSTVVTGIAHEENITPDKFELLQNYPNPFNPTTVIPFNINKDGLVKLEIYDLLGRKISTPVNKELKAGKHSINFDASELASGKYFYRVLFDGKQHAKMMILLK